MSKINVHEFHGNTKAKILTTHASPISLFFFFFWIRLTRHRAMRPRCMFSHNYVQVHGKEATAPTQHHVRRQHEPLAQCLPTPTPTLQHTEPIDWTLAAASIDWRGMGWVSSWLAHQRLRIRDGGSPQLVQTWNFPRTMATKSHEKPKALLREDPE